MKKIWIVKSVTESGAEFVEVAFTSYDKAREYATELDKQNNDKPQFVTDGFIKAYNETYCNIPDWEDYKGTPGDMDDWYAYCDSMFDSDVKYIIDSMYKKGFFVTRQMIIDYQNYENKTQFKWIPCEIEEIELIEE